MNGKGYIKNIIASGATTITSPLIGAFVFFSILFGSPSLVFAVDTPYDFEFANTATRLEHSRGDVVTATPWYIWWDDSEICDTGNGTLVLTYATGTQIYSTGSQQCNESGTAGIRGGIALTNALSGQPSGTYIIRLTASSSPAVTWTEAIVWNNSQYGGPDEFYTRITSVTSPLSNQATPSTNVQFAFQYYNADGTTYAYAGAEIVDITSQQTLTPVELAIISDGFATYATTTQLRYGNSYMWRPYLRNASSTVFIQGQWITPFGVVSSTGTTSPYIQSISSTTPSFFDFVNVPELLRSRVPFSYLFSGIALLGTIDEIPASSNSALVMTFVPPSASTTPLGIALTNVEMFSTSTITELMGSNVLNSFSNLMAWVMWLSMFWFFFHQAMHEINHKK